MSKSLAVILGVLAIVGVLAMAFISANNTANRFEKTLEAAYKDNQNILSNYGAKLAEAAQIPEQYKKDFIEVVKVEMEGRYGPADKAHTSLANFVTERQLSFDSSLYTKLQAMIEAGRNKFENGQTSLLDKKRAYETALGNFPGGFLMGVMGWPKVDLAKYDIIVTADVQEKFESKTDAPIKVFGN